mmetsp:Transcript_62418/g.179520  ORF Transcript_62418/g.179520 Transcript_62418/m.179520 type:complete len:244 (-) Transcript_62418:385-1116(-)
MPPSTTRHCRTRRWPGGPATATASLWPSPWGAAMPPTTRLCRRRLRPDRPAASAASGRFHPSTGTPRHCPRRPRPDRPTAAADSILPCLLPLQTTPPTPWTPQRCSGRPYPAIVAEAIGPSRPSTATRSTLRRCRKRPWRSPRRCASTSGSCRHRLRWCASAPAAGRRTSSTACRTGRGDLQPVAPGRSFASAGRCSRRVSGRHCCRRTSGSRRFPRSGSSSPWRTSVCACSRCATSASPPPW